VADPGGGQGVRTPALLIRVPFLKENICSKMLPEEDQAIRPQSTHNKTLVKFGCDVSEIRQRTGSQTAGNSLVVGVTLLRCTEGRQSQ